MVDGGRGGGRNKWVRMVDNRERNKRFMMVNGGRERETNGLA